METVQDYIDNYNPSNKVVSKTLKLIDWNYPSSYEACIYIKKEYKISLREAGKLVSAIQCNFLGIEFPEVTHKKIMNLLEEDTSGIVTLMSKFI